ncbi:MAG TPA: outer membrane lipoprotein-sorting protein [Anaeromyxobacteraceae bacterium]|nr:outer membrane lipoprotein-sorting protein [Anaeromyxobacteraceae bacterium]
MNGTWLIAALALAAPPARAAVDPQAVLAAIDDLYQGKTSQGIMEMEVVTPDWSRTMRLRLWSRGRDVFLVRVEAPAKDRGVSTLRNGSEIWNYLPNIDRTVRIPPAMLASAWMGSDLTNDDLVKLSRLSRDYVGQLTPGAPPGELEITALPKPDAAVVWTRIVARVRQGGLLPEEVRYYGDDGALARTVTFSDVRPLGGRHVPAVLTVVPAGKPGHRTVLRYLTLELDRPLPDARFSLHALRNP